jgi:F-type H+-transporting ATPase subunit delta
MSIIARRYAQALMNLAVKADQVADAAKALDEVADNVAGSERLQAYLAEPKVALSAKEAVISEMLQKGGVSPLVSTFVRFIARKRRIELLEDIRGEFHELADERMGRANAQVTVAAELNAKQQDALRSRLRVLTGKEIQLRMQVDPGLLGGFVARVGSTVWDSSLRNQLNLIHQSIAG